MISRDGDPIYFECDGERCHEVFETETYDFPLALSRVKEANWWVLKIGLGDWKHICPDCHDDWKDERRKHFANLAKKFNGDKT